MPGRFRPVDHAWFGIVYQGLITVNGYTDRFQASFYRSGTKDTTTKWINAEGFTAPFTTSVTYDFLPSVGSTACYCNGEATPSYTGANHWTYNGTSNIGGNPSQTSYTGKGRIQSIRLYSRALSEDEIARNALVDRVRFEDAAPPVSLEPSIVCSQLVSGAESGGALLEWTVSSFGWLASSLDSFGVEYAASSDFASPTVTAGITWDEASGYCRISSLVPGTTYYARVVATNDLGAGVVGDAFTLHGRCCDRTRDRRHAHLLRHLPQRRARHRQRP